MELVCNWQDTFNLMEGFIIIIIIIIITSHRLIACWGQLRLLLGSTCSRFLYRLFSFYRRWYLDLFPSNILTDDAFSTLTNETFETTEPVSNLSRVIPWILILRLEHSTLWMHVSHGGLEDS